MASTQTQFNTWVKDKDWFYVKTIKRNDGVFNETYLTPNGQEVTIYFDKEGIVEDVATKNLNYAAN